MDIFISSHLCLFGELFISFIANRDMRERAIAIINRDFPKMQCYQLDIPQQTDPAN